MRLWRGVSKCMFTCILTEDRFYNYAIKSAAATFKRSTSVGNVREHFLRDRQPCLKEQSDAQACVGLLQYFHIREGYIVPVSSNFLTQISCGIKTKCRKTRAMQRDFTIVDSLALRQCNTSMIPDTHSLKLLFPTRYYLSLNLLVYKNVQMIGAERRASMY